MHTMRRRAVMAVALGLLAIGGLAWTVAAVPADSMTTPSIQPGDRWSYNATGAVPREAPYVPDANWRVAKLAYQAGPEATSIDATGALRHGRQLDELKEYLYGDSDEPSVYPARSWYMLDGAEPVAARMVRPMHSGSLLDATILPGGTNATRTETDVETTTTVSYGAAAPLCGHWHDHQGLGGASKETLTLRGACGSWDGADLAVTLLHDHRGSWNGRQVETFAGEGVEAWLDAAIPVPVLVRVGAATFELTGYEAGNASAKVPFVVGNIPPVTFAPRTASGPDESGIEHVFRLSQAYEAARANRSSGLSDFLQQHPQAQVVAGDFLEDINDQGHTREWRHQWTFTVSDGAVAHGVQVAYVQQGPLGAPPLPQPLPQIPIPPPEPFPDPAGVVNKVQAVPIDPMPGPWPAPGDLPSDLPTVASLVARWQAYAGDRGTPNAWGFAPDCGPESCQGGQWHVWAGKSKLTHPMFFCIMACIVTRVPDTSLVMVDSEGSTVLHREVALEKDSTFDVGGLDLDNTPKAAHPAAASLGLAGLPLPAAGAIGLAAALAAAFVLAWPWIKAGGPLAMFSRVEGDRVLDNPRRAAAMQLIEAEPGIHLRELSRRMGVGEGALRHHLDLLQGAGRIRTERGPRYLCYFPARGTDRHAAAAAPLLKSEVARRLLERAVATPGLSGQQLAAELGVTPGAVTYHVQRLSAAGLLEQRRLGREVLVEATSLGRAAA